MPTRKRRMIGRLTGREIQILGRLAGRRKGLATNQALADFFGISKHTVKNTLFSIYSKLNVRNRVGAVMAYWLRIDAGGNADAGADEGEEQPTTTPVEEESGSYEPTEAQTEHFRSSDGF